MQAASVWFSGNKDGTHCCSRRSMTSPASRCFSISRSTFKPCVQRSFEIYLPLSRSAIAEYIGLPVTGRTEPRLCAFATLVANGVIESRDLRHVRIVDRAALGRLIAMEPLRKRRGNGEDRSILEDEGREI